MHRRIAVLTSPAQLLSSYTQAARRAGNVTQDRHRRDAASISTFAETNVRTHCCQKRPRPSRNVDDYCVGRLRRGAPDRDIILIPVLDWGNIKLVVWPHDSGVFLCVGITFASFLLRTCVQNYVRGRSGSGLPFVIHSCHLLDREDDVRASVASQQIAPVSQNKHF